ncbi:SNF2 helicase associated domain-containing protein [Niallia sp. Krafla_26]|uniref:SNF2 helicase associated domain-containing protein n=1 Tax=Niallia sp. Krafla_26 TaxID=3064703 RepID=UPI003D162663
MELHVSDIREYFSNAVYHRGKKYFEQGRVRGLHFDPVRQIWTAQVRGTNPYQVEIFEDRYRFSYECDCPAFEKYEEPCKHIAAVLLKMYESKKVSSISKNEQDGFFYREQLELERQHQERQANRIKQLTNDFIQTITKLKGDKGLVENQRTKSKLMVEWIVKISSQYATKGQMLIEMKVGQKRTYVVKKVKDFLNTVQNNESYPFTSIYTYDPTEQEFKQEDQEIIKLLQKAIHGEKLYQAFQSPYYSHSSTGDERVIAIPPTLINEFLEKINYCTFRFEHENETYHHIVLSKQELPFSIELDKGNITDQYQLDMAGLLDCTFLNHYGYVIQDNFFYKITPEQEALLSEMKRLIDRAGTAIIPIASDQMDTFISQAVPAIAKLTKLDLTDQVSSSIVKFPLQAKLFVDLVEEELHVKLEFHYGQHSINPFKPAPQDQNEPIIVRELEREQAILDVIKSTSLRSGEKGLYVNDEDGIYEFLYVALPKLENWTDIFLTQSVKSMLLPQEQKPKTNIDVHSSGNWLEVDFDMKGIGQDDIQQILQSVVEKKKYHRLPNGMFVPLQSEEFQTIDYLIQELHIKPQQLKDEAITLPIYRGIQLNEAMDHKGRIKYGKAFRRLLNRMKNPEELDFEVPTTLKAELRDYQFVGYQWLKTLHTYKLGGILADEMGLGKTLQSIAFILSYFCENEKGKPALIVAPASLVYNWKNEFQKFAPTLSVEVMIGTPQERLEKLSTQEPPNVWITSYPTLRQDIDEYGRHSFSTMILDEAQTIKNYATKTAKAVREIEAETRFALSGTPIENSVDELWSIFQTIMPNFFPPQKAFRQLEPEKISLMIRPFLLRRMKKDVLQELPEKIETVNYSDLTKEQKKLYVAYLEKIQNETKESLQTEGFQKSHIKILAGLTRLRQLCCHPSLFLENYQGESGKLEQLMEIVENAAENGRRMLIFSQFTSMLSIIREKLKEAGMPFFYLDGQTKPKERVEMVEQFNGGSGDVFLISLKAGNTGLNLTGADTVILYDLWWNPAVEEQAAGRAHRIGQKNVVQVIRLVTQGTIEEKIYKLQQSKKELIETVLEPGDQSISKITEEDIREILSI